MVEYAPGRTAEGRSLDRVYGAIAHPTRRTILRILADGDVNVGTLASRFPLSFYGVSKHIRVLERAGLVRRRVTGREHWLRLRPAPLREATRWLEYYREFWETRLDALEQFLVDQEGKSGRKAPQRGTRRSK